MMFYFNVYFRSFIGKNVYTSAVLDVRTALFVERMNERGFQLNCFQASNVGAFLEQIKEINSIKSPRI